MEKVVDKPMAHARATWKALAAEIRELPARAVLVPGCVFVFFLALALAAALGRPRVEPGSAHAALLPPPALSVTPSLPLSLDEPGPLQDPALADAVPAALAPDTAVVFDEFRAPVDRSHYRAFVRLSPPRIAPLLGPDRNMARLFVQAAEEYGVPAELLSAIAQEESTWHPWALNIDGRPHFPADKAEAARLLARHKDDVYDVGLMQINSYWIRKYRQDPVKLLDPETNIRFGAWILRSCFEAHGLTWRAVGAYHTGHPGRRMERTMSYASRVIQRYEELAATR